MRELRDRVDSIRRDLMSLPDVGKIQLLGEQEEQLVVAFSPTPAVRHGSGFTTGRRCVARAECGRNLRVPPARPVTMLPCASAEAFSSEESLRAVTLRVNNRYIPLTDIASIVRRSAEPPAPLFASMASLQLALPSRWRQPEICLNSGRRCGRA